jgi:hypothetical protein
VARTPSKEVEGLCAIGSSRLPLEQQMPMGRCQHAEARIEPVTEGTTVTLSAACAVRPVPPRRREPHARRQPGSLEPPGVSETSRRHGLLSRCSGARCDQRSITNSRRSSTAGHCPTSPPARAGSNARGGERQGDEPSLKLSPRVENDPPGLQLRFWLASVAEVSLHVVGDRPLEAGLPS